jgi:hypothetical protein
MLCVPTPPPTASGIAPANAATVMHAGLLMLAHPFSATKASSPPAVSLNNRLMMLSLSRLVGKPSATDHVR